MGDGPVGGGHLDDVVVGTLDEADIAPEDLEVATDLRSLDVELPEDAADDLATALEDCDLARFLEPQIVDQVTTEVGSDLSEEATTCLADNIADEDLTATAARTFIDQSVSHELQQMAIPAVNACPDAFAGNIADAFAAQLDIEIPEDAQACLDDYIDSNFEAVAAGVIFSQDETAFEGINIGLASACPALGEEATS